MEDNFYRGEFFKQLQVDIQELRKDVKDIKQKVWYMYGFAGGVALLGSFVIDWIKSKIWPVS